MALYVSCAIWGGFMTSLFASGLKAETETLRATQVISLFAAIYGTAGIIERVFS